MMTRRNSDGPDCRDCGTTTERVGTFSLCPNTYCARYAIPVNDQGLTEDDESNAEEQADGGSYYSSDRMAEAQRIGR